ncbi:MAG: hypothetical protein RLY27_2158 [Pseudomonadota bacterium]|jgi:hypothetical protein
MVAHFAERVKEWNKPFDLVLISSRLAVRQTLSHNQVRDSMTLNSFEDINFHCLITLKLAY